MTFRRQIFISSTASRKPGPDRRPDRGPDRGPDHRPNHGPDHGLDHGSDHRLKKKKSFNEKKIKSAVR